MSSESIPVGLRSLLSKHYFLAQITSGYKPCMSNMKLVDSKSWMSKPRRYWYGETRKTVISDIENIISQTIDAITIYRKKLSFLKLIINALASTRVGIESMTITYRKDPAMIGKIKVQLTNIDLQLKENRDLIKGYSSDEKIVDDIVRGSDTNDKEGLKKFLMGNTNNNNNDKLLLSEPSDLKDRDRERRHRERRREHHRVKQSTEVSKGTE